MPRDGVRFASLLPILAARKQRARVAVSAATSMSLPTIARSICLQKRFVALNV
jgi:uncharacterized membrane protein YbjE (DUF340 family)